MFTALLKSPCSMTVHQTQSQSSRCHCCAFHNAVAWPTSRLGRSISFGNPRSQSLGGRPASRKQGQSCTRKMVVPSANGVSRAEQGSTRIGFVGLGIMGTPMALNLVKAGYKVLVWNRSADKAKPLTDAGAEVAGSAREVAEQSDITIGMLADPAAARAVAGEVAAGLGAGKGYVDMSTIDAESAQAIRDQVKGSGAEYLEAPVSGSKQPAEQGNLVILAAGDRALFEKATPLFDVLGKASFYLGEVGNGANMKIAVNMLMGSMLASYAEALSLAEAAGLQAQDFVDVVNAGAMAAPIYGVKGSNMANGKYPPAFPLRHQKKDLGLAEQLGKQTSQPLTVAAAVHNLYEQAAQKGLGDEDFTAVLEAVGRLKR